jgi:hypothetical protein
MDWLPIFIQAAATFGNAALSEGAKRTIGEAWDAVKKVVVRKFGATHEAPQLLDQLKTAPTGAAAEQIGAKLAAFSLDADPDIVRALEALSAALKTGAASTTIAIADKVYGAQVNHGNIEIRIGSDH